MRIPKHALDAFVGNVDRGAPGRHDAVGALAGCGDVVGGLNDLRTDMTCANCREAGGMRPHVVWFGEMPLHMDRIMAALEGCGLFISIGTSGNVYPAAGFVEEARRAGALTIELNLEESEGATLFHEARYGPATDVVPAFVAVLRHHIAPHITQ